MIAKTKLTSFTMALTLGIFSIEPALSSMVLEEVVVTAQRREASLQAVPVAVTVFTNATIEEMSLVDVKDLQFWTPSLLILPTPGAGSNPTINLRGQAANDPTTLTIDDAVAIYFNDVYMGRSQGAIEELFDVQSVEVLKGSQGTLYGRNTTGGAIKIATIQADPGSPLGGYITGEAGEYNSYRTDGAVNVPMGNDAAVRLAARHHESDGWGKAFFFEPGSTEPYDSADTFGTDANIGYLSMIWNASDQLRLALNADYYENSAAMGHVREESGDLLTPEGRVHFNSDRDTVALNRPSYNDVENGGVSLAVDYEIDAWATKLILAHRYGDTKYGYDGDGSTVDVLYAELHPEATQDTVEFQVRRLALEDRLDWLMGVFYFKEDGSEQSEITAVGIPSAIVFSADDIKNESKAVFTHVIYEVSESFELGAGLRYTADTKALKGANRYFSACVYDPSVEGVSEDGCFGDFKEDYNFLTWSANVNWHLSDATMLYAKSGESYRPGGMQVRATGPQFSELFDTVIETTTPFDEESVIDYEVGVKSDFLDQRARVNTALYHTDYSDYQTTTIVGGSSTFVFNAGDADINGVEVEGNYLISESLTISAFSSWIDVEFKDGLIETATPEWKFGAGLTYTTDASYGDWIASLYYSWMDARYTSDPDFNDTNQFVPEEDYFMLNGRVQLNIGNVSLAVIGRNLTDEEYTTQVFPNLSLVRSGFVAESESALASPGEPRYLGFEARYNF